MQAMNHLDDPENFDCKNQLCVNSRKTEITPRYSDAHTPAQIPNQQQCNRAQNSSAMLNILKIKNQYANHCTNDCDNRNPQENVPCSMLLINSLLKKIFSNKLKRIYLPRKPKHYEKDIVFSCRIDQLLFIFH